MRCFGIPLQKLGTDPAQDVCGVRHGHTDLIRAAEWFFPDRSDFDFPTLSEIDHAGSAIRPHRTSALDVEMDQIIAQIKPKRTSGGDDFDHQMTNLVFGFPRR